MNILDEILAEKDLYSTRFHSSCQRIIDIVKETQTCHNAVSTHGTVFASYFHQVGNFLLQIADFYHCKLEGEVSEYSLEELKVLNYELYKDVLPQNYNHSFANPAYAREQLGEEFSAPLCTLYTELRSCIVYAFEDRLFYLTTLFELFIEIYNIMEQEDAKAKEVTDAIYYYFFDYADVTVADTLQDSFDPGRNFATDIICNCDLTDLRYLYYFGEYISQNEIQTATYLNSLSPEELQSMASTLVEGYVRGFRLYNIDLTKKKTVNIRYHLGFEPMIREVIIQLKALGLTPCIYRAGISISQRSLRGKIGYFGASPNKQYEYDHRMDDALFYNKAYGERRLQEKKIAMKQRKELLADFAGPMWIDTFGEKPFNPVEKKEALSYSQKQQKIKLSFQAANGALTNEYIPGEETSFSIIAYPLPEIGEQYQEIFKDTIKVNTLDQKEYLQIQSKIIDALDQGDYVTITGRKENKTHMTVSLTPLQDPAKETKFENCLADVNIPLGEVFTSPKLPGTDGVLHVTKVFLNDLEYHDLTLTFQDGVITDYSCGNFQSPEENRKYIEANVLFHHKTLPLGEFAIGTNTTAYAMGKKYHISHLLPILIAEKTGPHFAVGDTCFSHEEELPTYNPDGKQMIAKENEYSRLRNTAPDKAYFSCHTDITIPYDELGDICVHKKDGQMIPIIKEGRFVLPGTEALNKALD